MSGNGFYYDEFLAFANQFHKSLQEENFILDVLNKLGNIMLTTAKENTPVGQYDGTVFFTGYSSTGGRFIGHLREQAQPSKVVHYGVTGLSNQWKR